MSLRPYQMDLVKRFMASKAKRSIVVLPTGAGKTHVAVEIIRRTAGRVLVVAHRAELLDQMRAHVGSTSVVSSVLKAKREDGPFALIVIDEAHHTAAASYQAILEQHPDARVLGLTATPARLDGKPLDMFDEILEGPPSEKLVAAGHLAEVRYFAPSVDAARALVDGVRLLGGDFDRVTMGERSSAPELVGDIVDHWHSHAFGMQTMVFAVTVRHAETIAAKFRASDVTAQVISGETPKADRARLMSEFRSGAVKVLVNVELFGEGLDVPNVRCVVQARPTQSLTLFRQQCGRAMRPGNVRPVVLDHAGNVWRHGLPTKAVEWSLEGRVTSEAGGAKIARCSCGCVSPRVDGVCPDCGATIERAERLDPVENERAKLLELAKVGAITCAGGCGEVAPASAFNTQRIRRRNGKPWLCKSCARRALASTPEWKKKHAEQQQRLAADPEWLKNKAEANRALAADPKWRKKNAEASRVRSADPELKKKRAEQLRRLASTPEWKKKNAEASRVRSADPEWRKKNAERLILAREARAAKKTAKEIQ